MTRKTTPQVYILTIILIRQPSMIGIRVEILSSFEEFVIFPGLKAVLELLPCCVVYHSGSFECFRLRWCSAVRNEYATIDRISSYLCETASVESTTTQTTSFLLLQFQSDSG